MQPNTDGYGGDPERDTPRNLRFRGDPEGLASAEMEELRLLLGLCRPRKPLPTPSLILSKELLRRRAQEFAALAPPIRLFYSIKANPAPQVLRYMESLGLGFEISSLGELETLLGLGVPADRIITSNPVKSGAFISRAAQAGVGHFVFDSYAEAQKIAALAPGSAVSVRLAVDNSGSAWPLAEKYGVEAEEALELLAGARRLGLRPVGTAFHVGSQCTSLASWDSALTKTAQLWRSAAALGIELNTLNLGGGFPARHRWGLPKLSETLERILGLVRELFPRDVAVVAEPGRALVGDAGALLATVIGKALRQEGPWVYLDIGVFNGLMEAAGGITYAFLPLAGDGQGGTPRPSGEGRGDPGQGAPAPCTLTGPSCDDFDVVARSVPLPALEVGDRMAIYPGGAYTTTYASRFNGGALPKIILR